MRGRSLISLLLLGLLALGVACQQGPRLYGLSVTPTAAADFALTSQTGEKVRLGAFRGDLVVLTFLYTNCTTACPIIAAKLKLVADRLGPEEAKQVRFVAVSVDPERDTPEAATTFVHTRPSPQGLLFLTGARSELEPVWKSYHVETRQVMATPTPTPMEGTPGAAGMPTHGSHAGPTAYIVEHTVIAYLIDRDGIVQAAYIPDPLFEPDHLVRDLRTLLSRKGAK